VLRFKTPPALAGCLQRSHSIRSLIRLSRIGRPFTMGRAKLSPSLDIFNIGNVNTVLGRRRHLGPFLFVRSLEVCRYACACAWRVSSRPS
jgi:hypothetical protein